MDYVVVRKFRINGGCAKTRKREVSDRALRYRANQEGCRPAGETRCGFCGSKRNVEVHHVDGREEHSSAENLMWACRACNTKIGSEMKRAGIGRRTVQFNPAAQGAKSVGQWMTAVMSMKGQSDAMSLSDAVEMIRATSPAKRSGFASEIWSRRRKRAGEVPF